MQCNVLVESKDLKKITFTANDVGVKWRLGGRQEPSMLFTIRTLHSLFQNSKKNMLSKFIKDSFFICLKKVFCIYFPRLVKVKLANFKTQKHYQFRKEIWGAIHSTKTPVHAGC